MEAMLLSASFFSTGWGSALLMLVGFGLVVFVHELGHFAVAKAVGIKVEEFAIGFGKKLIGFRKGETEYRINVLPLGGYVKMLGQEDFALKEDEQDDPRAFNRRPIWARMCVVSAGVVMNVIFAALLFVVVFTIGKEYAPAMVGAVTPGLPADTVKLPGELGRGLQPGDVIETIDGEPIRKFDDVRIKGILSGEDETYAMTIRRPGVDEPFTVRMGVQEVRLPGAGRGRVFGISQAEGRTLSRAEGADALIRQISGGALQSGDVVVALDGEPIEHGWRISQLAERHEPRPFEVTVERTDESGETTGHTATVTPYLGWSHEAYRQFEAAARSGGDSASIPTTFHVLGLQPRMRIGSVLEGGPADQAGLRPGDVIANFGPNREIPTIRRFNEICADNRGETVQIAVLREGEPLGDVTAIEIRSRGGQAMIGVAPVYEQDNLVVAGVGADTPLAGLIHPGYVIRAVNGATVSSWGQLIEAVGALGDDAELTLTYETPAGSVNQTEPISKSDFTFHRGHYAWSLPLPLEPLHRMAKSANPYQAMAWGVRETGDFILLTYGTLKSYFSGDVSGKSFSGPVGIFSTGIQVGRERGAVWVIWLLAVISANLAVINFLPLPIVDGGIMVFLIIEKIRKKPLSVTIQNAVQIVGLAAIAVVFVLLTYNDLVKLLNSTWR